jgi:hypothetical protein
MKEYRIWDREEEWWVWYYKKYTNLSNREIGEILGRSKNSVNSHLNQESLMNKEPDETMPNEIWDLIGGK